MWWKLLTYCCSMVDKNLVIKAEYLWRLSMAWGCKRKKETTALKIYGDFLYYRKHGCLQNKIFLWQKYSNYICVVWGGNFKQLRTITWKKEIINQRLKSVWNPWHTEGRVFRCFFHPFYYIRIFGLLHLQK